MTRPFYSAVLITAAVFVTTMSTAVSAQPVFGECCARYDFNVTGAPRAIASADLSGDGFPDLALAGGQAGVLLLVVTEEAVEQSHGRS